MVNTVSELIHGHEVWGLFVVLFINEKLLNFQLVARCEQNFDYVSAVSRLSLQENKQGAYPRRRHFFHASAHTPSGSAPKIWNTLFPPFCWLSLFDVWKQRPKHELAPEKLIICLDTFAWMCKGNRFQFNLYSDGPRFPPKKPAHQIHNATRFNLFVEDS